MQTIVASPPGLLPGSPLFSSLPAPAGAQQWPAKPITIVNGFPAGAGTDIVLRMFQESLEKDLGTQLVFEYKPGAGGNVGSEYVAKAQPDGYTLMIATAGTHGINAALYKKLPFDVEADFTAIAPLADVPNVLTVNPTVVDAKTVKDFIAAVKAAPGKLNYGSTGNGASTHLGFAQFNAAAGLDMVHVPYKGSPEAVQAMVTGETCCLFAQVQTVLGQWRAGKVRLLGVSTKSRVGILADVPTIDEAGIAGVRERHLVRPRRPQGPRSEDRRAHQRGGAQGPGQPRPAREARQRRHGLAQRNGRAVPRHHQGRPGEVGRDRQGLRRQDRLSRRGDRRMQQWGRRGGPRPAPRADLVSGLLFAGLGAVILWVGADYSLGVPSRIGPGYVPRLLGILLAAHRPVPGRAVAVDDGDHRRHRRLAPAGAGPRARSSPLPWCSRRAASCRQSWSSVAIANYATPENRWTTAVVLGAVLAFFAWLLFVKGLSLPLPVWSK